jgi:hypothetical protein
MMKQMSSSDQSLELEDQKIVKLTKSQAELKLINPNVAYVLWPRAAGKTNAIGDRVEHLSETMPKAQILLFSDTFKRLEERIVPNILGYFQNEIGLIENEDFVVFKKPPEHFDKPITPLKVYDHVITFSSGLSLCLASQAVPGSANAYNAQAMLVDEAKYCKEVIINTEALPALRGAFDQFGHLPEYRSHWYFTDKFGENIGWLLAKKRLHDQKKIDAVITLSIECIKLKELIANRSSSASHYKYMHKLLPLEQLLQRIRKELVLYSDAPPYENLANLGEKYFRDLKRDLSAYEYSISVENKDPFKAEHSFYPSLTPHQHYHTIEKDIDQSAPLIIALDYNWRITPMVVAQFSKLPGAAYTTLNMVAAIHTLHPSGGIELTIKSFVEHYRLHTNKHVYYVYDHTAVGKRPDGNSFKQIVCKALSEAGWNFTECYMGQAPHHDIKFEQFKKLFSNSADMSIMINQLTCDPLIQSMEAAATVMSMGKTKKDKSKEKNLSLDPITQTDYSDALDQIVWAVLVMQLIKHGPVFSMPMTVR